MITMLLKNPLFAIILLCLLFVSSAFLVSSHPADYSSLRLEHTSQGTLETLYDSTNAQLNTFELKWYFFPKETFRQSVLSLQATPSFEQEDTHLFFEWQSPSQSTLLFNYQSQLQTKTHSMPIQEKISYPLDNIPLSLNPYLKHTTHIDSSPEIREQALSLARGQDDLFIIEAIIAQWIYDAIEYDLQTTTADANQPSSWVMEHRYGVCDEITNLFISMNRELGIPARFISGLAYSELAQTSDHWEQHGWAEVYFPTIGWVPYDVTYNQLGYIDSTHIALDKSVEGLSPAISYEYAGKDVSIQSQPLSYTTTILSKGKLEESRVDVTPLLFSTTTGFDSYNYLQVNVTNPTNEYVTEQITLHPVQKLIIDGSQSKFVVLEPHQSKQLYWMFHTNKTLDKDYTYTFPLVLSTPFSRSVNTTYSLKKGFDAYTKEYISSLISTPEQETTVSNSTLNCTGKQTLFLNETQIITCTLNATQQEFPFTLCYEQKCKELSKPTSSVNFTIIPTQAQTTTATIIASSQSTNFITNSKLSYTIKHPFPLVISSLNMSKIIFSDENKPLFISLEKLSSENIKNIVLALEHPLFSQSWDLQDFTGKQEISIELDGSHFHKGNNTLLAITTYEHNGISKTSTENITVLAQPHSFAKSITMASTKLAVDVQKKIEHSTSISLHPQTTLLIMIITIVLLLTLLISLLQKLFH
ncbi:MAG: transglutaminase-like domain-containing protein [Nanobdellota archaeon]